VSDTSKMKRLTGWSPRVGVEEGVGRLYEWLGEHLGKSRRIRLRAKAQAGRFPGQAAWGSDTGSINSQDNSQPSHTEIA